MINLKLGWSLSTIGELASFVQRGKSPKYTDYSELPVINQKCIRWNKLETQHLKFIHPEQIAAWDTTRYISAGDILWNSTGTGTVGRAYLVSEIDCDTPKVVDSHVTIVRSCNEVDPRYLFNWIKGPLVQQKIEEMCDGTTNQIELSRRAITETEIPIAPINEQKRIADKLDAVLARVDCCRDSLDRIPNILKRFRQSVLDAAVEGRLTSDLQMKLSKKNSWKSWAVSEVALVVDPHPSHRTPPEDNTGVPYISIGDINSLGEIDFDGARKVSREIFKEHQARYTIKQGDFIFGKIGTLGKPTKLPTGREYTISANVLLIQAKSEIVAGDYLRLIFSSPVFMADVTEKSAATSQSAFGIKKMREATIELPDMEEQHEIVRRVESLFAYADRLEARYKAARSQVDKLTPALLAKAFRGELVTQDPNDEPAIELLARIAATREKKETARPRKPTTRKLIRAPKENSAMTKSRQDDDVKNHAYLAKHLRLIGGSAPVETLFKASELPVADFYKQLAWEVAQGYIQDGVSVLEAVDAA